MMMARYKCAKCGLEGTSKNIRTRSFFPSNQLSAMLTQIVDVTTEMQENGLRKVTLEFKWCDTDKSQPDDELEMQVVRNIQLDEDTIRHWLCSHKYELISGEEI